mmetsp:Transcript_19488/g.51830  ORF Transcript_19488/g.51830 Transcript_19488/m.51830 type:complete len:134 (+) Transcript_19488:132-533(+)
MLLQMPNRSKLMVKSGSFSNKSKIVSSQSAGSSKFQQLSREACPYGSRVEIASIGELGVYKVKNPHVAQLKLEAEMAQAEIAPIVMPRSASLSQIVSGYVSQACTPKEPSLEEAMQLEFSLQQNTSFKSDVSS